MGTMKAAVVLSLAAASSVALAQPPSGSAVPVTVDNYNRVQSDVNFDLTVNAGKKMHRPAGAKMHHGRMGEGCGCAGLVQAASPRLSFPVRSMSLLSRPDLASFWARRAA